MHFELKDLQCQQIPKSRSFRASKNVILCEMFHLSMKMPECLLCIRSLVLLMIGIVVVGSSPQVLSRTSPLIHAESLPQFDFDSFSVIGSHGST